MNIKEGADNGFRVELRLANPWDADAISRLAELDSAPEPRGEVLLAFLDGEPVAAMSLDDRLVVADPFVPTRDVVALMQVRAQSLLGLRRRRRLPRLPRLRFA